MTLHAKIFNDIYKIGISKPIYDKICEDTDHFTWNFIYTHVRDKANTHTMSQVQNRIKSITDHAKSKSIS